MELNYTKNGKYKVMVSFENGPTFIFNRFDTLEEAEYVIESYSEPKRMADYFINTDSEFWLEVEE
jgi:hypothetical protein